MAFLSAPKINKYTTFQGDLLHGVIEKPADKGQMRLTLLINYWDRQPLPPNCVTLDHSKLKGVEVLSPAQIQALEQKFKVGGQAPTEHEEEKEVGVCVFICRLCMSFNVLFCLNFFDRYGLFKDSPAPCM